MKTFPFLFLAMITEALLRHAENAYLLILFAPLRMHEAMNSMTPPSPVYSQLRNFAPTGPSHQIPLLLNSSPPCCPRLPSPSLSFWCPRECDSSVVILFSTKDGTNPFPGVFLTPELSRFCCRVPHWRLFEARIFSEFFSNMSAERRRVSCCPLL